MQAWIEARANQIVYSLDDIGGGVPLNIEKETYTHFVNIMREWRKIQSELKRAYAVGRKPDENQAVST